MKTITLKSLQRLHACKPQVALFQELFGESVEVTEELCVKHARDFDWCWAAEHLLTKTQQGVYDEATAPAWKVYGEATAPAWKVYNDTWAALKVYDDTRTAAWKVCDEATAADSKVYDEATAAAFAKAFNS
jgi:hypothetical protein